MGIHPLEVGFHSERVRNGERVGAAFAEAARHLPRVHWLALEPLSTIRLAVIIDRSDSAQPHYSAIASHTRHIIETAGEFASIVTWVWDQPIEDPAQAVKSSYCNASLFAPVWRRLQGEFQSQRLTHAVIIGAGPLFDIADYDLDDVRRCVSFMSLADDLTGGLLPEHRGDPTDLLRSLQQTLPSIKIGAPGVLPFWWDNPAYAWNGQCLEFNPQNELHARSSCVRTGWLCAGDSLPVAEEVRSGQSNPLSLISTPPMRMDVIGTERRHFKCGSLIEQGGRRLSLPHSAHDTKKQIPTLQSYQFLNGSWHDLKECQNQ